MHRRYLATLSLVSLIAWSTPVMAKPGHGQGKGKAGKSEHADKEKEKSEKHDDDEGRRAVVVRRQAPPIVEHAVVVDRDGHRRIVTEYFSRESLPPGLAKRDSLPPGLQKQLRERGHLPPGLQKRLVPVPGSLVTRLPAVPSYYSRYFVGRDLVVVDTRSNTIVAVIPDVVVYR